MSERIIDGNKVAEDDDLSLRPLRLADYVGQDDVKGKLEVYLLKTLKKKLLKRLKITSGHFLCNHRLKARLLWVLTRV